jgi:putative nucleotidyltransferase with HDIG domain
VAQQAAKTIMHDTEMLPIQTGEFTHGTAFAADVFVRLGPDSYLLVARVGQTANLEELHFVERNEVEYLYVRRADYKECVGQNVTIAGIIVSKAEISTGKKTEFISKAADGVFREIDKLGVNEEAVEHAKLISSNIRTLVEMKQDIHSVLEALALVSGDLLRHSIAVSIVTVMIAHELEWKQTPTLEKLALAGLLHDIGLKEVPEDILAKPRHALTQNERVIFESHPFRGAEILRSMPSVSTDLISMVYEHHENGLGQGYPRRIRDLRLHPMGKLVGLADLFCELAFLNESNPNPKTPVEAISFIESTLGQPYNKQNFAALKRALLPKTKASAA